MLFRFRTDGWADRQTHDDSMYRASIASRGKKYKNKRIFDDSVVARKPERKRCYTG